MNWYEYFYDGKPLQFLIGLAGAAAMAATDFRSWRRVIQHLAVGVPTAMFAAPIFAPAISKMLGIFTTDVADQKSGAIFITGAFGIYMFEFIKEFFMAKKKRLMEGKDLEPEKEQEG